MKYSKKKTKTKSYKKGVFKKGGATYSVNKKPLRKITPHNEADQDSATIVRNNLLTGVADKKGGSTYSVNKKPLRKITPHNEADQHNAEFVDNSRGNNHVEEDIKVAVIECKEVNRYAHMGIDILKRAEASNSVSNAEYKIIIMMRKLRDKIMNEYENSVKAYREIEQSMQTKNLKKFKENIGHVTHAKKEAYYTLNELMQENEKLNSIKKARNFKPTTNNSVNGASKTKISAPKEEAAIEDAEIAATEAAKVAETAAAEADAAEAAAAEAAAAAAAATAEAAAAAAAETAAAAEAANNNGAKAAKVTLAKATAAETAAAAEAAKAEAAAASERAKGIRVIARETEIIAARLKAARETVYKQIAQIRTIRESEEEIIESAKETANRPELIKEFAFRKSLVTKSEMLVQNAQDAATKAFVAEKNLREAERVATEATIKAAKAAKAAAEAANNNGAEAANNNGAEAANNNGAKAAAAAAAAAKNNSAKAANNNSAKAAAAAAAKNNSAKAANNNGAEAAAAEAAALAEAAIATAKNAASEKIKANEEIDKALHEIEQTLVAITEILKKYKDEDIIRSRGEIVLALSSARESKKYAQKESFRDKIKKGNKVNYEIMANEIESKTKKSYFGRMFGVNKSRTLKNKYNKNTELQTKERRKLQNNIEKLERTIAISLQEIEDKRKIIKGLIPDESESIKLRRIFNQRYQTYKSEKNTANGLKREANRLKREGRIETAKKYGKYGALGLVASPFVVAGLPFLGTYYGVKKLKDIQAEKEKQKQKKEEEAISKYKPGIKGIVYNKEIGKPIKKRAIKGGASPTITYDTVYAEYIAKSKEMDTKQNIKSFYDFVKSINNLNNIITEKVDSIILKNTSNEIWNKSIISWLILTHDNIHNDFANKANEYGTVVWGENDKFNTLYGMAVKLDRNIKMLIDAYKLFINNNPTKIKLNRPLLLNAVVASSAK